VSWTSGAGTTRSASCSLGAGLLSGGQFSAVVVVLVATSVIGPVLLRLSWRPARAASGAAT